MKNYTRYMDKINSMLDVPAKKEKTPASGFLAPSRVPKESMDVISKSLKANISVVQLTNVMIKAGIMQGVHSIDSAMLAFPVIAEMIKTIADISDIGYVESEEDFKKATELDESVYIELIKNSQAKIEEAIDQAVLPKRGLMSKGVKE